LNLMRYTMGRQRNFFNVELNDLRGGRSSRLQVKWQHTAPVKCCDGRPGQTNRAMQ